MTNFDQAFTELLGSEGGYVDHPADPGGETNWGITVAVARQNGYVGTMRDLPQSLAKTIYRRSYWLPEFDLLPYPVAFQLFDGAVNSGVAQSLRWLQRAVKVPEDGVIGAMTVNAVLSADPQKLVLRFNAERLTFMTNLPTWTSFGKGWARRIAINLNRGAA